MIPSYVKGIIIDISTVAGRCARPSHAYNACEEEMNWARLVSITVGAGVVSSLTDWFFASDWIHRRYAYPEIWRQGVEGRAIALTSPLPFLTCGVFAYVAARLGVHSVSGAFALAVAVWLIGPLPLILTNAAFMKLHRVFVAAYAIGWLAKLTIIALTVGWFLR
jgi:hypothetical protein